MECDCDEVISTPTSALASASTAASASANESDGDTLTDDSIAIQPPSLPTAAWKSISLDDGNDVNEGSNDDRDDDVSGNNDDDDGGGGGSCNGGCDGD